MDIMRQHPFVQRLTVHTMPKLLGVSQFVRVTNLHSHRHIATFPVLFMAIFPTALFAKQLVSMENI